MDDAQSGKGALGVGGADAEESGDPADGEGVGVLQEDQPPPADIRDNRNLWILEFGKVSRSEKMKKNFGVGRFGGKQERRRVPAGPRGGGLDRCRAPHEN